MLTGFCLSAESPQTLRFAMAASTTEPYPLEKRRYHRVMVKDQEFDVDERYTKLKYIGGGAYGFVAAAYDTVRQAVGRLTFHPRCAGSCKICHGFLCALSVG